MLNEIKAIDLKYDINYVRSQNIKTYYAFVNNNALCGLT